MICYYGNDLLATYECDPEIPLRNYLTGARQAAQRSAELSRLMLLYVGQIEKKMEPFDFGRMLDEERRSLEALLPANVRLQVMADSARSLTCRGDRSQILRALTNLVVNAVEAIGDNPGVVRIEVSRRTFDAGQLARGYVCDTPEPGPYLTLSVSDDGHGICEDDYHRIFEPFFTTRFIGRGLGLPTVLGIVRAHYGQILVESTEGRGTTFHLLLPCKE